MRCRIRQILPGSVATSNPSFTNVKGFLGQWQTVPKKQTKVSVTRFLECDVRAHHPPGAATVGRASEVRRGTESPGSPQRSVAVPNLVLSPNPAAKSGRVPSSPRGHNLLSTRPPMAHEVASATVQRRKSAGFPAHPPPQTTASSEQNEGVDLPQILPLPR